MWESGSLVNAHYCVIKLYVQDMCMVIVPYSVQYLCHTGVILVQHLSRNCVVFAPHVCNTCAEKCATLVKRLRIHLTVETAVVVHQEKSAVG